MTRARDLADFNLDGKAVTINESSADLDFRVEGNGNANLLFVDAGNDRVGIGTSSPATALTIASEGKLRLYRSDNSRYGDIYNDNSFLNIETSNDPIKISGQTYIKFDTDGSEAMRISGSNVLVGKTSVSTSTAGFEARSDGLIYSGRDGNEPLILNRLTSDGTIVGFRKDGTTVGTIAARVSNLRIGTDDIGLEFHKTNNTILPANMAAATLPDNTVDLGQSNVRFKDLYLGGGAYIGGTGSANLLDDYEEGTYTPTIHSGISGVSYSAQVGRYTKVGRVVYFLQHIDVASHSSRTGSQFQLGGLPFTSVNIGNVWGSAWWVYTGGGYNLDTTHITWAIQGGTTKIIAYKNSGAQFVGSNISDANAGFHLAGFYFV